MSEIPLDFTAERWEYIKQVARKEYADWVKGDKERVWHGETWHEGSTWADQDYELCFDCDEDDRHITVELYRIEDVGFINFDKPYIMTAEDLGETP